MSSDFVKPRWLRDLLRFLPLKSQFVLSGNVKDLQTQEVSSGRVMTAPLVSVLSAELAGAGFARIVSTSRSAVFASPPGTEIDADDVLRGLGLTPSNGIASAGVDLLAATLARLVPRE